MNEESKKKPAKGRPRMFWFCDVRSRTGERFQSAGALVPNLARLILHH
jgi:hypothetical protein